jgi:hypothetical protein
MANHKPFQGCLKSEICATISTVSNQSWSFYLVLSTDDDTSSVVLLVVVGSSDATAFTIGRPSFHGAQILGADFCGQNPMSVLHQQEPFLGLLGYIVAAKATLYFEGRTI